MKRDIGCRRLLHVYARLVSKRFSIMAHGSITEGFLHPLWVRYPLFQQFSWCPAEIQDATRVYPSHNVQFSITATGGAPQYKLRTRARFILGYTGVEISVG